MEIRRYEAPFDCEDVVRLWAKIFGQDEALLEKPQVDGSESTCNRDVVYAAYDKENLVGAIHATFPKDNPDMCGFSGMCTHPSVRGTGLGRILFEKIVEEADREGAEYAFLGTGNPIAAKLYHSYGFSFLPGTKVMARFRNGDWVDMDRKFFVNRPEKVRILEETPSLRIPMISFILYRGPHFLMDRNTGIFNSDYVTQFSCMGLYPRYAKLSDRGGCWRVALDADTSMPGALLSMESVGERKCADFFYTEGFREAAEELLDTVSKEKEVFFIISERDTEKQKLLLQKEYREAGRSEEKVGEFSIPCVRYEKK